MHVGGVDGGLAAGDDARGRIGRRMTLVQQARRVVHRVLIAVPAEVLRRLQTANPILVVAETLATWHLLGRRAYV